MARRPGQAVKAAKPRRYARRKKVFAAHKMTMELAEALADETLHLAWEMGLNTVSAVVDEGGALKAFRRPDGSNLGCVDFAILKARSAVTFNTATHVFYPSLTDQPETVAALAALPGFTVEGGGVPIRLNGEIIGGIGVSGAPNWREDVEVIAKAFKKLGLDPIA